MCGTNFVDQATADKIAATAAKFRQITESPFGPDDEIGMLNLITPESMRAVLSRADAGHTLDLSVDYFLGMPSFTAAGQPPYQIWMTNTPRGTAVDDGTGFGEQNKLVGYSGLNPKIKQSGQTARIGRMSKAGPDTLRWAAVEASQQAWHILSRDQPFKPAAPRAATHVPASSSIRLAH